MQKVQSHIPSNMNPEWQIVKQETSLPLTSSAFCATCSAKTQDVQSDYFACISVGVKKKCWIPLVRGACVAFLQSRFSFFCCFSVLWHLIFACLPVKSDKSGRSSSPHKDNSNIDNCNTNVRFPPPPTSHYVRLCWNVKMGCSVVFFVVVFFTVDNILHLQNQCAITPCDPYGVRNGLYGATKIITQDAGVCVWPAVHLFKKKKKVF